jgi:uncharacterized protein
MFNLPVDTLFRFWRTLAHLHGQQFNASAIGASLGGVSHKIVATYLATLVDAMMVRKLAPRFVNLGKRLVKSPTLTCVTMACCMRYSVCRMTIRS